MIHPCALPASNGSALHCVALETLITELMAAGGPPAEPPTPQEVVDNLQRVVFEDGSMSLFLIMSSCSDNVLLQTQFSTKRVRCVMNP
ncbi:MAG TPA: hypothetical protein VGO47_12840 [Chlamydiales bacterium]|jgi:hypothetical protein|nr:hypothetical protein [Chlamydiales bacterium]